MTKEIDVKSLTAKTITGAYEDGGRAYLAFQDRVVAITAVDGILRFAEVDRDRLVRDELAALRCAQERLAALGVKSGEEGLIK